MSDFEQGSGGLQNNSRFSLSYMKQDEVMAVLFVDYKEGKVQVINYTDDIIGKPFGVNIAPDLTDFEEFLKERCFPEERYDKKLILRVLGLDYFEPLHIVRITHGRMVDDCYWIKFEGEDLQYERDIKFRD
ncbi:MAG: hypothetical protein FWG90_07075 [Oscillospiraceae bacterium]|nr:hypothetical protein [Oscillospiraceae bacterium]